MSDDVNLFDKIGRYAGGDNGAHHLVSAIHGMPTGNIDCHYVYLFNPFMMMACLTMAIRLF